MKAKKHLGQHFLTSQKALRGMVSAAQIGAHDTVLEIGPGKGALTKYLLDTGAKVVAIETDPDMIAILSADFKSEIVDGTLELVHADIRNSEQRLERLDNYKLVANIPYYITGEIIRDFLSRENQPASMTLLVQREVATRIARDPKESILSLSVKIYGKPTYIETVPAGAFSPPPAVDSAIIHIAHISKEKLAAAAQTIGVQHLLFERHFFDVVKTGLAAKRKMLRGNLARKWEPRAVASAMEFAQIAPDARGEDVRLEKWITLAQHLKNIG